MFPWLVFLRKSGKKLSDIEFLSIKEFGGKLVENDNTVDNATGDLATLTANSGKDMYLASAKVNCRASGTANAICTVALIVDTVTKETYEADLNHGTGPDSGNSTSEYTFTFGYKVVATKI